MLSPSITLPVTFCRIGHVTSVIGLEIKIDAHNNSGSLTIARAETTLGALLEACANGDGESSPCSYIL